MQEDEEQERESKTDVNLQNVLNISQYAMKMMNMNISDDTQAAAASYLTTCFTRCNGCAVNT